MTESDLSGRQKDGNNGLHVYVDKNACRIHPTEYWPIAFRIPDFDGIAAEVELNSQKFANPRFSMRSTRITVNFLNDRILVFNETER